MTAVLDWYEDCGVWLADKPTFHAQVYSTEGSPFYLATIEFKNGLGRRSRQFNELTPDRAKAWCEDEARGIEELATLRRDAAAAAALAMQNQCEHLTVLQPDLSELKSRFSVTRFDLGVLRHYCNRLRAAVAPIAALGTTDIAPVGPGGEVTISIPLSVLEDIHEALEEPDESGAEQGTPS